VKRPIARQWHLHHSKSPYLKSIKTPQAITWMGAQNRFEQRSNAEAVGLKPGALFNKTCGMRARILVGSKQNYTRTRATAWVNASSGRASSSPCIWSLGRSSMNLDAAKLNACANWSLYIWLDNSSFKLSLKQATRVLETRLVLMLHIRFPFLFRAKISIISHK